MPSPSSLPVREIKAIFGLPIGSGNGTAKCSFAPRTSLSLYRILLLGSIANLFPMWQPLCELGFAALASWTGMLQLGDDSGEKGLEFILGDSWKSLVRSCLGECMIRRE